MKFVKATMAVLLLLLPLTLFGQSATTSLHGIVSDVKGAVLPNAEVTLSNPATGYSQVKKSGPDGAYDFLQIRPGSYNIQVSAAGFKTEKQTVVLQVNMPATLNVTLDVGATQETLEVKAESVQVNTTDATMGNTFNVNQIENLPFEGRNVVEILSLQPGVTYIGNNLNQDSDSRSGAVNGARSDQSNVTLDGLDNNDQTNGYAFTGVLRSTLDSVQEFRVTTTNGNADAGRGSGAQVSLVTKSGTNDIHGSGYFYLRPTATSANDWFNKQGQISSGEKNKPPRLDRRTFGATLGGPILKNKVFFFLNYEGQRTKEQESVTRLVPTQSLRDGFIKYYTCGSDIDCVSTTPSLVTLSPAQLAAMDQGCLISGTCVGGNLAPGPNANVMNVWRTRYPLPNGSVGGDGLNFGSYTFAANIPSSLNTYIAKLDWNINDRQTVFVRGNLQNDVRWGSQLFPGDAPQSVNFDNTKGIAIGHTWTISNAVVNNFRWGFIRQGSSVSGVSTQDNVYFRGLTDPDPGVYSRAAKVPVNNFIDDVTWLKGKHTIQAGANFRLIHNDRMTTGNSFNSAVTNPSWLGAAGIAETGQDLDPGANGLPSVASFFWTSYDQPVASLMGLVTEGTANYNVKLSGGSGSYLAHGAPTLRNFRAKEFEYYLQDSWRVKPNLTITLGLRHSLLQPPYEANGQQVAPTFSLHDWFEQRRQKAAMGQTYHPLIAFSPSGQGNGKAPYWNMSKMDFAPRFALAWSPAFDNSLMRTVFGGAGKSSIRLGYGMYYDHFGQGIVNSFDNFGSFGLNLSFTNAAGDLATDTAPRYLGPHTVPDALLPTAPAVNYPMQYPNDPTYGYAITWGLDDKLKTPYSHVFNFSIERELPANMTFEVAYVGRLGRRLMQQVDLAMYQNLVDPTSKMDYFTAATALSKAGYSNTPWQSVAPIPYWENMFGAAKNNWRCAPYPSVTQCIYDFYWTNNLGNETWPLYVADVYRGWGKNGPLSFFDDQFSSLFAWQSSGTSAYHGAQFILRRRKANGLQFDFNYTFAKSLDLGSDAERQSTWAGSGFSTVINSWNIRQMRSYSDFDVRHSINANWIYELPFGKGKPFGAKAGSIADHVIGGWALSGLFRWTSGLPFDVANGLGSWATNWDFTGYAMLKGDAPKTGVFIGSDGNPYAFADPAAANKMFRLAYPGESGQRNVLRGPGYFGVDLGLAKTFNITENHKLRFSWEVFNVTNSVRFDPGYVNNSKASQSFGKYTSTLTRPRAMQFALRYSF